MNRSTCHSVFCYRSLPDWFSHQPRHALVQQFWRSRHNAHPVLPRASLRVTDENGVLLADIANANCKDYRLCVELLSGSVVIDLYRHYLMFAILGGHFIYQGSDRACRTYVKFGECMQDIRVLHVRIRPFMQKEAI